MPEDLKRYRVFIASPGGLAEERRAFKEAVTDYNEMDAMERGIVFTPVGWEITLGGVGRPQGAINEDIKKCDYFVLLLWDRWGSRPDLPGKGEFSSGTEEEYHLAWKCLNDDAFPMRQVVVFFKAVEPRQINDPGTQLKAVLDFKRELEDSKKLLFHTFDEVRSFERWLEKYLAAWVRDHENGDGKTVPAPPTPPPIASDLPFEFSNVAKPELAEEKAIASSDPNAELLKQAEALAGEGRVTEAEVEFARAIASGNDPDALNRYGHFLSRLGRLDQARVMYERVLTLAEAAEDEMWQAKAYGNLGLIYKMRGELDRAEEMLKKSLAIEERLGRQEYLANQYGNLGLIYHTRRELDRAEEMLKKSLAIEEKLGRQEGMARQFGNLGLVYLTRGELDRAEEMLKKALAIQEKLGLQEYMANQYANLGSVAEDRRELDQARELWIKASDLYAKIGMPHMVKQLQEWLDGLSQGAATE